MPNSLKPRHVILIVADSLRYDSVHHQSAPPLPYLSKNAIQFSQARSSGCWTLPATSSLFTGLLPHQHGATTQTRKVRTDVPTLAEKMKAAGYRTHQVTANVVTTHIFGLDRGFDEIESIWKNVPAQFNKLQQFLALIGKPRFRRLLLSKDALSLKLSEDLEMGKAWLQFLHQDIFDTTRKIIEKNEQNKQKSFIFLNLMETHFPYHIAPTFALISPEWRDKFREMRALFRMINQSFLEKGKIGISEDMLHRLRERQRKSWDNIAPNLDAFVREMHEDKDNLVVFCSDHGDNFGEQGWVYHFSNVTDAGNRVPLFYLPPHQTSAKVIDQPVNTKDIHSSILQSCHLPSTRPSLLNEPELSNSVLQSYWYNKEGHTLPQYRYNQICFVHDTQRYLYRQGLWHTAPISQNDEAKEAAFQALPPTIQPLKEVAMGLEKRQKLEQTLKEFKIFSGAIG